MKKIIPMCGTDQVNHTHLRISPLSYTEYYGFPEIVVIAVRQIVAHALFSLLYQLPSAPTGYIKDNTDKNNTR